jgi:hypothetical protein
VTSGQPWQQLIGDGCDRPIHPCNADAAIWAEQQLVAIPGWLLEDQNARLDQEGQFASFKESRLPTIIKNKAKRRTIYCRGGRTRWRPKSFQPPIPPPPPSGDF